MSWADTDDAVECPAFPDVGAWVTEWLTVHYARDLSAGRAWCAEWWRHPEAVSRLTALWERFEKAQGGGSLAGWWRDYADPTMSVLLDERGPFSRCRKGHRDLEPLPVVDEDAARAAA